MAIEIGSRVRSFDFYAREIEGERAAFVEGEVVGFTKVEGCDRYDILVDRDVFRGEEHEDEHSRVGSNVYPPLNGTPTMCGEVCDGVHEIE